MTIYEQLIEGVLNGKNFSIDFLHRNLRLNGKYLVKNGEYEGEYGFIPCKAKEKVEELFEKFYRSRASEWGDRLSYFKAKSDKEMTDEERLMGEPRLVALAELEGYILGLILSNCPFSEFAGNDKDYVWQSKNNSELVMFKEWFEGETNVRSNLS